MLPPMNPLIAFVPLKIAIIPYIRVAYIPSSISVDEGLFDIPHAKEISLLVCYITYAF
jgi:hypothetical protein